jgi:hypothetical protein
VTERTSPSPRTIGALFYCQDGDGRERRAVVALRTGKSPSPSKRQCILRAECTSARAATKGYASVASFTNFLRRPLAHHPVDERCSSCETLPHGGSFLWVWRPHPFRDGEEPPFSLQSFNSHRDIPRPKPKRTRSRRISESSSSISILWRYDASLAHRACSMRSSSRSTSAAAGTRQTNDEAWEGLWHPPALNMPALPRERRSVTTGGHREPPGPAE